MKTPDNHSLLLKEIIKKNILITNTIDILHKSN